MSGGGGGSEDADRVEMMIRCEDCGHLVPSLNLAIHQLHACRSSSSSSTSNGTTEGAASRTAEIPLVAGLDAVPQQQPQELPSWMVSRFWNSSSAPQRVPADAASAPPAEQDDDDDDRKMPARQRSSNSNSNGIAAAAARGGANSGGISCKWEIWWT